MNREIKLIILTSEINILKRKILNNSCHRIFNTSYYRWKKQLRSKKETYNKLIKAG